METCPRGETEPTGNHCPAITREFIPLGWIATIAFASQAFAISHPEEIAADLRAAKSYDATGFEFQMPKVEGSYNDNQYNFTAEDIRFTRSKGKKALYAILLKWPDAGAVTIYHEG